MCGGYHVDCVFCEQQHFAELEYLYGSNGNNVCLIEFPSIQVLKLAAKSLLARTLCRPHFEGPPVIIYLSADLSGKPAALIFHSTRSERRFIIIDTPNDVCGLLNWKIHYRSLCTNRVVHRNGSGNNVHFLGLPNATGFDFGEKTSNLFGRSPPSTAD